jgi:hypothetical protein
MFFNTSPKNSNSVGNFVTNTAKNVTKNVTNIATNTATNVGNFVTNTAKNVTSAANTAVNSVSNTSSSFIKKGPTIVQIILIIALTTLLICMAVFWKQIRGGWDSFYESVRTFFGAPPSPPPSQNQDNETVTQDPVAPQDAALHQEKALVEKVLPGRQQVFNISKNTYTYYDAEPLCKALGGELATYEQVKQAYAQGADWCNYGWVKGQMAVYPTQTDTWQQLQQGPEEQRGTCGRPGINGGYFDNPELRYGVNCYGIRPDQKDHDATAVASGEGAPLSPGGLEFERKTNKYRGEANSISILPFSKNAWSN